MASQRDENGHFLPGTVPNPHGRPPKERCITDAIRAELDRIPDEIGPGEPNTAGLSNAQLLAARAVAMARETGNPAFYKEILDRIEGKVKDQVEVGGEADLLAALTMLGRGDRTK